MEPSPPARRRVLGAIGAGVLPGCTTLTADETSGWTYEVEERDLRVDDRSCDEWRDSASVEFGSNDPVVSVTGTIVTGSRCDRVRGALFRAPEGSNEEMVIVKVATAPTDESCAECTGAIRYDLRYELDRRPVGVDVYHHPHDRTPEQVAVARVDE